MTPPANAPPAHDEPPDRWLLGAVHTDYETGPAVRWQQEDPAHAEAVAPDDPGPDDGGDTDATGPHNENGPLAGGGRFHINDPEERISHIMPDTTQESNKVSTVNTAWPTALSALDAEGCAATPK